MTGYSQPLRAMGQALEVINIQAFEMEIAGNNIFIRGHMPVASPDEQRDVDQLRVIWGAPPGAQDGFPEPQRRDSTTVAQIDLCYTELDIERLEEEGRSRRGTSHAAAADAWSLSQILRSIGAYLNQKRARLSNIRRESDCVILEYETSAGSTIKETLAMKDLYDLWVRMYLQRAERATS